MAQDSSQAASKSCCPVINLPAEIMLMMQLTRAQTGTSPCWSRKHALGCGKKALARLRAEETSEELPPRDLSEEI